MRWIHFISFYALRSVLFPFSLLPLRVLYQVGRILGKGVYHLAPPLRKKTWSHLSLAFPYLEEKELKKLAQDAFGNLLITCLEYGILAKREITSIARCANPEIAIDLLRKGQPPIFFCGHQANWEVLFLEGTHRMPGVAIGRPIKNTYLYNWILRIRQKYGGVMIPPKSAVKEGLRGLKRGSFLGIVGDQGMPDSGFCSLFFGKLAWTSPLPALLSYRTGSPVIVATTEREKKGYLIRYSDPIFPDTDALAEIEIPRIMKKVLELFEASIKKNPSDWLWIHNRWKQQPLSKLKRIYRHESICIVLTQNTLSYLSSLRTIYPYEFITAFLPKECRQSPIPSGIEVVFYEDLQEVKVVDYRFKLLFNFSTDRSITRHFRKLSVLKTVHLVDLRHHTLEELLYHAP